MIYPVESLIYGLFFMTGLFYIIAHTYGILTIVFAAKGWLTAMGVQAGRGKARAWGYLGHVFLVLALLAGGYSSYIGYGDESLTSSIEITDS